MATTCPSRDKIKIVIAEHKIVVVTLGSIALSHLGILDDKDNLLDAQSSFHVIWNDRL